MKQENIKLKFNNTNLRKLLNISYDCGKEFKNHYQTEFDYDKQL